MTELYLHHPDYDPDKLLDTLIERFNVKNDVGLCRVLDIQPPVLSKIRHRRLGIGPSLLISMHEESGLSIKELRLLMGDCRNRFRPIPSQANGGRRKGPASSLL